VDLKARLANDFESLSQLLILRFSMRLSGYSPKEARKPARLLSSQEAALFYGGQQISKRHLCTSTLGWPDFTLVNSQLFAAWELPCSLRPVLLHHQSNLPGALLLRRKQAAFPKQSPPTRQASTF
jgi:hypothetical protein